MGLHQVVYTGYHSIFLSLLTGSTMQGDYANERSNVREIKKQMYPRTSETRADFRGVKVNSA